ncbi:hypothetical protein L2E82_38091 [Cichorium intybus]|uniref:Uncharacterized protein n=1 Tax=Cichorium intybus TaxID=13427 RepID=A0ACB9AFG5_CICIN|nr:hypothetical protein L2E82_38091 [Cichorium intybus]
MIPVAKKSESEFTNVYKKNLDSDFTQIETFSENGNVTSAVIMSDAERGFGFVNENGSKELLFMKKSEREGFADKKDTTTPSNLFLKNVNSQTPAFDEILELDMNPISLYDDGLRLHDIREWQISFDEMMDMNPLSLYDDGILRVFKLSFSDDGLHDSRLSFSDDGLHDSRHSLYDDGYLHDSRETTVIDDDSVDSDTVGSFCTMSQVLVHWRPTEEEAIYNYFVSNIAAYVPTVQQKQGKCTSISNSTTNISFASAGERYISKVKALEAGKAAKRRQDEKEKERRLKKEAFKMERERVKKEKEREMELNRKIKQEEMKKKEADMAARRKEMEKEERAKRRKEEKRIMRLRQQRLLHASLNASTSPDCSLKNCYNLFSNLYTDIDRDMQVLLECKKASLRVPHLFDGMEEGRLMGCKVKNLTETLSTNKKQQQAIDTRDALVKFVYRWLVETFNKSLKGDSVRSISILYIYGFESFQEYESEGIEWKKVEFVDNQLFEKVETTKAIDTRDALVKFVYRWLVETINKSLKGDSVRSISILDIYGFESFQEYESEGIEWKKVEFVDNQLFEKNGAKALLECKKASLKKTSLWVPHLSDGMEEGKSNMKLEEFCDQTCHGMESRIPIPSFNWQISASRRLSEILFQCIALNASTSPDCSLKAIHITLKLLPLVQLLSNLKKRSSMNSRFGSRGEDLPTLVMENGKKKCQKQEIFHHKLCPPGARCNANHSINLVSVRTNNGNRQSEHLVMMIAYKKKLRENGAKNCYNLFSNLYTDIDRDMRVQFGTLQADIEKLSGTFYSSFLTMWLPQKKASLRQSAGPTSDDLNTCLHGLMEEGLLDASLNASTSPDCSAMLTQAIHITLRLLPVLQYLLVEEQESGDLDLEKCANLSILRKEAQSIPDLHPTSRLMECKVKDLMEALSTNKNQQQAIDTRDALVKFVYRWLVETINKSLKGDSKNSFDELLINYANERLQQQEEYESEGIERKKVEFVDNQLFEKIKMTERDEKETPNYPNLIFNDTVSNNVKRFA